MKILAANIKRILGATTLTLLLTVCHASKIEIRFNTAEYNAASQELFVDIQVRNSEQGQVVLAGQNYRFYYDSEVLELDVDATKSKLPAKSYGAIKFEDHIFGVEADQVNQLIFDDNLGFANFAIDLTDNLNGGISVTANEWSTVATLKFDVKDNAKRYDVVWGREGVSDLYATAFVELGKWVAANKLDKFSIDYYGDLSSEIEESIVGEQPDVRIGPNPSSDFIQVSFKKELSHLMTVVLRDISGRQVKQSTMGAGSITKRIDVADLAASTYVIEIYGANQSLVSQSQIIVAK